jgi:hypothetical protein
MRFCAIVILATASNFSHSADLLRPGSNAFSASLATGTIVSVRVDVTTPPAQLCEGWRWGAEAECPNLSIGGMQVHIASSSIFVPRSAFADLGSPIDITIVNRRKGFDVIIRGGDAATSYIATLQFSNRLIEKRRVESGEFGKLAWENTIFSFNN